MFGKFSNETNKIPASTDPVIVLFRLLDEYLDEIEHAEHPCGFFIAYKSAVDVCAEVLSLKRGEKTDKQALKALHYLFGDKTEITNRFLRRLSTSGRLSYDIDELVELRDEMTEASYEYFLSLTGIDELTYTYCTVTFGGNRNYDYICEIPGVSVGDEVIVPVGDDETEKLARVTAINEYRYDDVPYPVSKTKKIIAKYGCGL